MSRLDIQKRLLKFPELTRLAFMGFVQQQTLGANVSPMLEAPKKPGSMPAEFLRLYEKFNQITSELPATIISKSGEEVPFVHHYAPPLYDLKAMIGYLALLKGGEKELTYVKTLPFMVEAAAKSGKPKDLINYIRHLLVEAKNKAESGGKLRKLFIFHDHLEDADDVTAIMFALIMAKRLNLDVHIVGGASRAFDGQTSNDALYLPEMLTHLTALGYIVDMPTVMTYEEACSLTAEDMNGAHIFQCSPMDRECENKHWEQAELLFMQGSEGGFNDRGDVGKGLKNAFQISETKRFHCMETKYCGDLKPYPELLKLMCSGIIDLLQINAFKKLFFRCPTGVAENGFNPVSLIGPFNKFGESRDPSQANWNSTLGWAVLCRMRVKEQLTKTEHTISYARGESGAPSSTSQTFPDLNNMDHLKLLLQAMHYIRQVSQILIKKGQVPVNKNYRADLFFLLGFIAGKLSENQQKSHHAGLSARKREEASRFGEPCPADAKMKKTCSLRI